MTAIQTTRQIAAAIQGAKGGGKGGGGKSKGQSISPDTLGSRAKARFFDIVSEGETGGLYTGDLKSMFAVEGTTFTQIMNDDGSFNIEGVTITERLGTPDQSYVSGFPEVEYESVVNVEVTTVSSVTRTINDLDLDRIRVKIRWGQITVVDSSGDIRGAWLELAIDLQPDGGSFSEVVYDRFTGKSESPYEREYNVDLPAGQGPWTIRVRRIDPDPTTKRNINMYWSSYTGVIDAKLRYPHTAGYFVEVDAEQFSNESIPGRAYLLKGIKIEVPTNYDPVTREYATTGPGTTGGIWDGTFKREVCGCPPWVFRDLAINKRYGAGDEIDASQVDKWTLYEIAQYCDEMVDDGRGGLEPRYEINTQINSQEQAYALLQAIASAFRGFPYWGAGPLPLTAGQDRPGDAAKQFSPANVIGGSFNREGVDYLARHSVALVSWNDPEDAYRTAVEQVIDNEALRVLGWRPIQVAAFGCTSQGRAHRLGRWVLDTEKNETETITFAVALQHADVNPGDIVKIADPMVAGVRYGGNIVSATNTSLTIDQAVEIVAGEDYVLNVTLPDGTISPDIPLTNAPGSTSVLTWDAPVASSPQANALWVISAGIVEPELFRVLKIVETDKHLFEITALKHDTTKYARVEQGINLEPPSFTLLPTGPIKAPLNLTASGYLFNPGPAAQVAAILSWSPPQDARVTRYELEAMLPGDDVYSVRPDLIPDFSYVIPTVGAGEITFRVRSRDSLGRRSAWSTFTGTIKPIEARPDDVENFRCTVLGETATLRWDSGLDYDIDRWWIRFQPVTSSASWESAIDIETAARTNPFQVPAMVGTYLIKAVDFLGGQSQNAAEVVNLAGGLNYFNVVETLAEDPDFDGAKTDVVYDVGLEGIVIDGAATEGTYNFDGTIDLGAVYTSQVTADIIAGGVNTAADVFAIDDVFGVEDVFFTAAGDYSVDLQFRTTPDNPSGSPVWSGWDSLLIGSLTFRAIEFRIVLRRFVEDVTPLVTRLRVSVDMPDRRLAALNVSVPDTGLTVAFDPDYKSLKALSITLLDGATGDYIDITSQDETGFTVFVRDSGGSAIGTRHINWDAAGWGLVVT